MLHYFQVALFPCCTLFVLLSLRVALLHVAIFPCCTFPVLQSFYVLLFLSLFTFSSCYTFFRFALLSCCTLLKYRYFFSLFMFPYVSLFPLFLFCIHASYFCVAFIFHFLKTFHVLFFPYCTFSMLHSFPVLLFLCCNFFLLHLFMLHCHAWVDRKPFLLTTLKQLPLFHRLCKICNLGIILKQVTAK